MHDATACLGRTRTGWARLFRILSLQLDQLQCVDAY
jgi:hypothetical protein